MARNAGLSIPQMLANPDVMDRVIIWRMGDPKFREEASFVDGKRSIPMAQVQWTIEVRADFSDKEKNDVITRIVKSAAKHLHANCALLADGQRPQIAVFSDDFFIGREEIELLEDEIGNAIAAEGATGTAGEAPDGEAISDELLQAARDIQHDKNSGS